MEGSSTDFKPVTEREQPLRFDTPSYERLLRRLVDEGRTFVGFEDRDEGVVLHHDVELSLDRALTMARLEATLRIGSTYCVPLDAPLHDVSTMSFARTVRTFSQLGHDVGLQFDADAHWSTLPSDDEIRAKIDDERETLRRILGEPIDVVSFRQPTRRLCDLELPAATNACRSPPGYQRVSDRTWRTEGPFADGFPERFRLLVHPGLWHPAEQSESEIFDSYRRAAYRQIEFYFEAFSSDS